VEFCSLLPFPPSLLTIPYFIMPATKSILSATKANNNAVFSAFKIHCAAPRVDTKTTALTLIRNDYPDYHVTEVEERTASLFEFAIAGHAELNLDVEDESFNATREWEPVGEGIEKTNHPGKLKDEYRFAR
jgi:transitional endoplasmic reticulum ATPase